MDSLIPREQGTHPLLSLTLCVSARLLISRRFVSAV